MSKKISDRQKAANDVARLRRNSVSVTGPREPKAPLPRREMLCGGEFVEWDALADARLRLQDLPLDRLPLRCRRTVDAAIQDTSVRTLRRARAQLFEVSASANVDAWISQACARVEEMLAFNLAGLGDHRAAAEVSAAALCQWSHLLTVGQFGEAFLCLRTAIVWAGDAQFSHTDTWKYPDPTYPRLHALEINPERMMEFAQALADAEAQLRAADDVLKGGAGMTAPPVEEGDLALDFGNEPGTPVPPEATPDAPAVRTLVVVPSLAHLPKPSTSAADRRDTPRAEFEPIAGRALPLRLAPDPHSFVEEASARAPWLRPVLEILATDLVGAPHAWLRPTLLVGGPGAGKTAAAARIAQGLGLSFRVYGVTSTADGSFAGTSRQWNSGRASIPAQTVRQEECASVAIVVDELEKGTSDRRNGRLDEALLPFLERESARRVFDPYLECAVDLSAITYLATANDLAGVPGPLRDRFRIIRVPLPSLEDLPIVAANIVSDLRSERGLDAAWLPDLDGEELDLVGRHWRGGSLRPLRRLVETVLAGRDRLAPRH